MALENIYLKRRPEGRRFTRTAAARNVSNVTIRVFGKGANRCAGSAAAGYVLVTQTFPQAHKQHHSSETCYQYPEPPRRYIAAIGTGGASSAKASAISRSPSDNASRLPRSSRGSRARTAKANRRYRFRHRCIVRYGIPAWAAIKLNDLFCSKQGERPGGLGRRFEDWWDSRNRPGD